MEEENKENNEVEEKAREHGWVPKDEFKGDESLWVPADVWMNRSKNERLMENSLKEAQGLIKRLQDREKTLESRAKKQALQEIRKELKEAASEGDMEAFNEAEKKLDDIAQDEPPKEPFSSPQEIAKRAEWLEKYPQYLRADVKEAAGNESQRIMAQNPDIGLDDLLEKVHERVSTKVYPEYFGNKKRTDPPKVEGSGTRGGSKAKPQVLPHFKKQAEKFAEKEAKFGAFKNFTGDGFEADKKAAYESYMKSYETQLSDEDKQRTE